MPAAHRRNPQSLLRTIDGEPGAAAFLSHIYYSQANTRAGDRGALHDFGSRITAKDRDAGEIACTLIDRTHFSEVGDNAGEHALRPHEAFDLIKTEFFSPTRCKSAGKCLEWHFFQRSDARRANGLCTAKKNCFIDEIGFNETARH